MMIFYLFKNGKIFKNKTNQGFGLNYKFSISFAKNNYKNIIFLHGDNQYPAEKINLIENVLNYHYVMVQEG